MTVRSPAYSKEDHARRGTDIYESKVRSQVEASNQGRIVAIDVDSDDFEVAESSLAASQRLLARRPRAQIWCIRIGHPAVDRFGSLSAAVRR